MPNVLNPKSGIDAGDVAEITVRRNTGTDKSILWDESRQDWFIQDSVGEKYVTGDRGEVVVTAEEYQFSPKDGESDLLVQSSIQVETLSESNNVDAIGYSSVNGYVTYSVGSNGDIFVRDSSDRSLIDDSISVGNTVTSISWKKDGSKFAVGSASSDVYIYEDGGFNQVNTLTDPGNPAVAVDFSDDGRLAVGSWDGNIYVYEENESTGELEQVANSPLLETIGSKIQWVNWNEDTNELAAAVNTSSDEDKLFVFTSDLSSFDSTVVSDFGDVAVVDSVVKWKNNGDIAISCAASDVVELYSYNASTGNFGLISDVNVELFDSGFEIIDFSEGYLSLGVFNGDVLIYDTSNDSFDRIQKFTEATDRINSTVWNPDTFELAAGSDDQNLRFYSNILRNKLVPDSSESFADSYEITVINNGDEPIEINPDTSSISSLVGSNPKIIDQYGEATVTKLESGGFRVEGDIYKETSDGFTKSA